MMITLAWIALIAMSGPLGAELADTEGDLLLLEAELDREQEILNERRKQLEQRKFELQLMKARRKLDGAVETPEEAAFRLELLRIHAEAQQKRAISIAELDQLAETMEVLQKGDGRVGRPRAFGPRAKAIEEENLAARKEVKTRSQELMQEILTSMETILNEQGSLNDAEYQWLLSHTKSANNAWPALDQATLERVKFLIQMEHRRRNPPPAKENKNFEYP
ncbi:MAG: hypothetical protein ACNA8L_11825 [Luteolibacter sp.]